MTLYTSPGRVKQTYDGGEKYERERSLGLARIKARDDGRGLVLNASAFHFARGEIRDEEALVRAKCFVPRAAESAGLPY